MTFSDALGLIVTFGLALIVSVLAIDLINTQVLDVLQDDVPASFNTSIQQTWSNNKEIYDGSFAAMFFLFAIISIGLTIFLASHPFLLVAWIFFNIILMWVWDALRQALVPILASSLNTGAMATAVAFAQNDLASVIIIINIFLGIVLFAKNVYGGRQG